MTTELLTAPTVSGDTALRAALADAASVYDDLHLYHITLKLDVDGWRVDFEFKDEDAQSGGPHYVIDATTGAILSKRYEQ
jgi:uncharacterized membrane protein YkoI